MQDSKPSHFVAIGRHTATLTCLNCGGNKTIGWDQCPACHGVGNYTIDCGGYVEGDLHYENAYCRTCGKFIPLSEVG